MSASVPEVISFSLPTSGEQRAAWTARGREIESRLLAKIEKYPQCFREIAPGQWVFYPRGYCDHETRAAVEERTEKFTPQQAQRGSPDQS